MSMSTADEYQLVMMGEMAANDELSIMEVPQGFGFAPAGLSFLVRERGNHHMARMKWQG